MKNTISRRAKKVYLDCLYFKWADIWNGVVVIWKRHLASTRLIDVSTRAHRYVHVDIYFFLLAKMSFVSIKAASSICSGGKIFYFEMFTTRKKSPRVHTKQIRSNFSFLCFLLLVCLFMSLAVNVDFLICLYGWWHYVR